jgi:hypothetical protein
LLSSAVKGLGYDFENQGCLSLQSVGMTHELPDLEPTEQDRREIGMDAGEVVPETVVVPRPVGRVLELPLLETFELNQPEVMIDAEEEIMPDSIVIAKEVVAVVPAPAVEVIQVCYPRPSSSVIRGANFAHTKTFDVYNLSWVTNDPEILSLEEFRTVFLKHK